MGSFKDILVGGLRAFAHGVKVLGFSAAASVQLSKKRSELKKLLLARFTAKQLDEIGRRIGVSLSGVRTKSGKVSALAKYLSFEDAVKLARRYKVKHKDLLEEFDRFKAGLESRLTVVKAESKMDRIVQAVREFQPEPIHNENDLEKQLFQFLKAKFPDVPIRRQVRVGGDLQVDIMAGPCGIELKVPRSRNQLQRLIGQVRDYSDYLECVMTVILDVGAVKNLNSYVNRLAEMGTIPIIIHGELRKPKQTQVQPLKHHSAPQYCKQQQKPKRKPPAKSRRKQRKSRYKKRKRKKK